MAGITSQPVITNSNMSGPPRRCIAWWSDMSDGHHLIFKGSAVTMSVHDALELWQEGRMTAEEAMRWTGCTSVGEMVAACWSCGVPVVRAVSLHEMAEAEEVAKECLGWPRG